MLNNLVIWYGEDNVEVENDSGSSSGWNGATYAFSYMFDGDAVDENGDPTIWHSTIGQDKIKTLKFTFKQPINFNRLTIKKRRDVDYTPHDQSWQTHYNNVCVELDGNTAAKLCTDTPNGGFNGVPNTDLDLITWTKVGSAKDALAINCYRSF